MPVRHPLRHIALLCLMQAPCGVQQAAAAAWTAPVPDIVLYCTPAMNDPLERATRLYTARSHVRVHIFMAPPDGLLGLLKHRARDDVVVADADTLHSLAAGEMVRPETVVALGRDPFVLVGMTGGAVPAGLSAVQLVSMHRTVRPDPTTAASFDGAAVLREAVPAGASAEASPGEIGVADTPTVIAMVRRDGALLGLVMQTEAQGAGIRQVAKLNVAPRVISGGLVRKGQSANAAALLDFLAGPDGQAALNAAGLERLP